MARLEFDSNRTRKSSMGDYRNGMQQLLVKHYSLFLVVKYSSNDVDCGVGLFSLAMKSMVMWNVGEMRLTKANCGW